MGEPDIEHGLVWITRTARRAKVTSALVEAQGFRTLIDPVLAVQVLSAPPLPEMADGLIFTSRSAVEIFAKTYALRDIVTFSVGDATAEAARRKGFNPVLSASGDATALHTLIATHSPRLKTMILAAPETPAAPLDQWLTDTGFEVHSLTLYRTYPITPHKAIQLIENIDIALLYSPRAGRHVGTVLRDKDIDHLTFICISVATANALISGLNALPSGHVNPERENVCEYHPQILISQFPDEASMLMLLSSPDE